MLSTYDATMAKIAVNAEVPMILVGDSLGMVMLGYESTIPVSMDEMLHHARAVARGAHNQVLVGDLPFGSYLTEEDTMHNASAFLQAGMHSVKVEGGGPVIDLTEKLSSRGIPVVAHVGLTPQFLNALGSYKTQGRDDESARRIKDDAVSLEQAGAFAVVLEGMPSALASEITKSLSIPTIGIGAGNGCDAQVLVMHDLLGLTQGRKPKFVKNYADFGTGAVEAIKNFAKEVANGEFPDSAHSYD